MTRVSFTPAPSEVGVPRRVRVTVAGMVVMERTPLGTGESMAVGDTRSKRVRSHTSFHFREPGAGSREPEGAFRLPATDSRLPCFQAPGAVDAGVAGEVRGDGGGADVLAAGEGGDRLGIQAEAAEIVGEVQHAAGRQPGHGRAQQAHVAGLHVEIARAL